MEPTPSELDDIAASVDAAVSRTMYGLSPPKDLASNPFSMATYLAASDIMRNTHLSSPGTSVERQRIVGAARLKAKQKAAVTEQEAQRAIDTLRKPVRVPDIMSKMQKQLAFDDVDTTAAHADEPSGRNRITPSTRATYGLSPSRRPGLRPGAGSPGQTRFSAYNRADGHVDSVSRTFKPRPYQLLPHTIQPMSPGSPHQLDDDGPRVDILGERRMSTSSSSSAAQRRLLASQRLHIQRMHETQAAGRHVSSSKRGTLANKFSAVVRTEDYDAGEEPLHPATASFASGADRTGNPSSTVSPGLTSQQGNSTKSRRTRVVTLPAIPGGKDEVGIEAVTQTSAPSSPVDKVASSSAWASAQPQAQQYVFTSPQRADETEGRIGTGELPSGIPPIHVHVTVPSKRSTGGPTGGSPFTRRVPIPSSRETTAALTSIVTESSKQTQLLRSMLETQAQAFTSQITMLKAQVEAQIELQAQHASSTALAAQEAKAAAEQAERSKRKRPAPVVIPITAVPQSATTYPSSVETAAVPSSASGAARVAPHPQQHRRSPIAIPITVTRPVSPPVPAPAPVVTSLAQAAASASDATSPQAMADLIKSMWKDALQVMSDRPVAAPVPASPSVRSVGVGSFALSPVSPASPPTPASPAGQALVVEENKGPSDEMLLTAITAALLTQTREHAGLTRSALSTVQEEMSVLSAKLRHVQAEYVAVKSHANAQIQTLSEEVKALASDAAAAKEAAERAASVETAWKASIAYLEQQLAASTHTLATELAEVRGAAEAAAQQPPGLSVADVITVATEVVEDRTSAPLMTMADSVRGLSEKMAEAVVSAQDRAEEAVDIAHEAAQAAQAAVEAVAQLKSAEQLQRAPSSSASAASTTAAPQPAPLSNRLNASFSPEVEEAAGFIPEEDASDSSGEMSRPRVNPFIPRVANYGLVGAEAGPVLVAVPDSILGEDGQEFSFDLSQLSAGEIILAPGTTPQQGDPVRLFPLSLTGSK